MEFISLGRFLVCTSSNSESTPVMSVSRLLTYQYVILCLPLAYLPSTFQVATRFSILFSSLYVKKLKPYFPYCRQQLPLCARHLKDRFICYSFRSIIIFNTFLKSHISAASSLFFTTLEIGQVSAPYNMTGRM